MTTKRDDRALPRKTVVAQLPSSTGQRAPVARLPQAMVMLLADMIDAQLEAEAKHG